MGNGATRTDLQYKEYLKYLEVIFINLDLAILI
jgi:hypothetical protein